MRIERIDYVDLIEANIFSPADLSQNASPSLIVLIVVLSLGVIFGFVGLLHCYRKKTGFFNSDRREMILQRLRSRISWQQSEDNPRLMMAT